MRPGLLHHDLCCPCLRFDKDVAIDGLSIICICLLCFMVPNFSCFFSLFQLVKLLTSQTNIRFFLPIKGYWWFLNFCSMLTLTMLSYSFLLYIYNLCRLTNFSQRSIRIEVVCIRVWFFEYNFCNMILQQINVQYNNTIRKDR